MLTLNLIQGIQHPGCEGMGLGYAAGTATTTCPSYSYNQEFPQHTEGRRRTAGCTKKTGSARIREARREGGKDGCLCHYGCATFRASSTQYFLRNLPSVLLLLQNVSESLKSRAPNQARGRDTLQHHARAIGEPMIELAECPPGNRPLAWKLVLVPHAIIVVDVYFHGIRKQNLGELLEPAR